MRLAENKNFPKRSLEEVLLSYFSILYSLFPILPFFHSPFFVTPSLHSPFFNFFIPHSSFPRSPLFFRTSVRDLLVHVGRQAMQTARALAAGVQSTFHPAERLEARPSARWRHLRTVGVGDAERWNVLEEPFGFLFRAIVSPPSGRSLTLLSDFPTASFQIFDLANGADGQNIRFVLPEPVSENREHPPRKSAGRNGAGKLSVRSAVWPPVRGRPARGVLRWHACPKSFAVAPG